MGFRKHNRQWVGALVALVLLLVACGSGEATRPEGEWALPEADRVSYEIDCEAACAAEGRCPSWPDDQHCLADCQGMRDKGGLQAAYLEAWANCALALPAACSQVDVDACWRQARAACQPPAELDALAEAWCTKWLECNGAPVGPYLDRCLGDVEVLPDMALLSCMTPAALEGFMDCAEAADCESINDQPLLQLCWSVYW